MKKYYETPSVEKISFRYRDQIVVASGETEGGSGGSGSGIKPPSIGEWTNNPGTSGCKWYLAEAWGANVCDLV